MREVRGVPPPGCRRRHLEPSRRRRRRRPPPAPRAPARAAGAADSPSVRRFAAVRRRLATAGASPPPVASPSAGVSRCRRRGAGIGRRRVGVEGGGHAREVMRRELGVGGRRGEAGGLPHESRSDAEVGVTKLGGALLEVVRGEDLIRATRRSSPFSSFSSSSRSSSRWPWPTRATTATSPRRRFQRAHRSPRRRPLAWGGASTLVTSSKAAAPSSVDLSCAPSARGRAAEGAAGDASPSADGAYSTATTSALRFGRASGPAAAYCRLISSTLRLVSSPMVAPLHGGGAAPPPPRPPRRAAAAAGSSRRAAPLRGEVEHGRRRRA